MSVRIDACDPPVYVERGRRVAVHWRSSLTARTCLHRVWGSVPDDAPAVLKTAAEPVTREVSVGEVLARLAGEAPRTAGDDGSEPVVEYFRVTLPGDAGNAALGAETDVADPIDWSWDRRATGAVVGLSGPHVPAATVARWYDATTDADATFGDLARRAYRDAVG